MTLSGQRFQLGQAAGGFPLFQSRNFQTFIPLTPRHLSNPPPLKGDSHQVQWVDVDHQRGRGPVVLDCERTRLLQHLRQRLAPFGLDQELITEVGLQLGDWRRGRSELTPRPRTVSRRWWSRQASARCCATPATSASTPRSGWCCGERRRPTPRAPGSMQFLLSR